MAKRTPEMADVRVVLASSVDIYYRVETGQSFEQLLYVPKNPAEPTGTGGEWGRFLKAS
ncbi:hypothetical protein HK405_007679, partial [Cladochytrium tenue]